MRIGVVVAKWNREITEKLELGALQKLEQLKVEHVKLVNVAGAFEVPLAAQWLFEAGFDAVVAIAVVIRGDTDHYTYVCNAVERGCSELQLKYNKPVAFGVLTTENEQQALDRAGGSMGNKGAEAAEVAVEMLRLQRELSL